MKYYKNIKTIPHKKRNLKKIKIIIIKLKQNKTRICAAEMAVRYAALSACRKTYVTLAHKRKQKFFYFGCSLVRRFYCKITKLHPLTGRTDRQTDRQSATQYAAPS